MSTEYLNLTGHEMARWYDLGRCPHCGSQPSQSECFCRRCVSCTQVWKAATRASYVEGPNCSDLPAKEYCPYCQKCLADLVTCIAAESDAATDAVLWRDVFCHECDDNDCLKGTAQQLAEKIFERGWIAENLKFGNLNCAKCQDPRPVISALEAEAEDRYARWKDSRFGD